jgi:hypothetical protein
LRRKAHTAQTAPLVLHHTGIDKYATKKLGINGQWRNILFFYCLLPFLLVKAAVNAPRVCKVRKDCLTGIGFGAMVLTKRLHFFILQFPKEEQGTFRTSQFRFQKFR